MRQVLRGEMDHYYEEMGVTREMLRPEAMLLREEMRLPEGLAAGDRLAAAGAAGAVGGRGSVSGAPKGAGCGSGDNSDHRVLRLLTKLHGLVREADNLAVLQLIRGAAA